MSHSEELRRYWRDAQRRHRANALPKNFKPRVIQKKRCRVCGGYHISAVIKADGNIVQFKPEDFHSKVAVDLPMPGPLQNCMAIRRDLYAEDEQSAEKWCRAWLNDPTMKILSSDQKNQIANAWAPDVLDGEQLYRDPNRELDECIAQKINDDGLTPQDARAECLVELELEGKLKKEQDTRSRFTVPDVYGKTAAEIKKQVDAESRDSEDPLNLYGLTSKEIEERARSLKLNKGA